MPRGRSRKNTAEAELLPLEENSQSLQQVREVKHKTEWVELHPVEEASDGDTETDFEDEDIEDRPRRKTKNARDELRKKLRAQGVSPSTNLRLYIEKYLHSDSNTGGSYAETEFCTKYETTEEHILNKDYIDVARRWGAGKYRITVRMQNKIVDAFDQRISAAPSGQVIQNVNPNDPNSPQVIFQSNGDGQQIMPSLKDAWKAQREALKEQLEMAKLMREAYGLTPDMPTATQQSTDPEVLLLQNLANNDKFMEKVNSGLLSKLFGKGAVEDDPSWSAVGMEAVKSGQLAGAIDAAFKGIAGLVNMILPRRDNSGQTPMGQAPMAQSQGFENPAQQNGQTDQLRQSLPAQSQSQGASSVVETGSNVAPQQQSMTPIDALVYGLIGAMERQAPIIEAQNIINIAIVRNPDLGDSVDEILNLNIDQILALLTTYYPKVSEMPHAREWLESLIGSLTANNQEGEDE
jgi:hypothetical protein